MADNKPFCFIEIDNGEIVMTLSRPRRRTRTWAWTASRRGAKQCGRLLARILAAGVVPDAMYSSSIDFPHEYGAPRINFRAAIADGAGRSTFFDPINGGRVP